jgi:hypothetical protein
MLLLLLLRLLVPHLLQRRRQQEQLQLRPTEFPWAALSRRNPLASLCRWTWVMRRLLRALVLAMMVMMMSRMLQIHSWTLALPIALPVHHHRRRRRVSS